jgi:uncharacterized protein
LRAEARTLGIALALAALAGGACRLPRASAPPRYWVLTTVDGDVPEGPVERTIGVGPIELPAYLDRAGVVTRAGSRVEVAPFDLWGQPLADNVTQVLGRNLERLAPGTAVEIFPWNVPSRALDRRVVVRIARFEADADGNVHLEASWDVRSGAGTELLASGRSSIREPLAGGAGVEQITGAMSRALGALSRNIAAQLIARRGP